MKLDTKFVGDIEGEFFIPSYQRGYRWGKDEVVRLLEDIYSNGEKNYCLQPIVVKQSDKSYELIDGQQRLTTLYLIYKYMNISTGFFDPPKFSIVYETREKSEEFLKTIDENRKNDNIDFFFLYQAYENIKSWFEDSHKKKSTMTNFNKFLDEYIKVIWYEVDDDQDSIELFTRLNIGKIPLTNAELVKSMFLCRKETEGENQTLLARERQEEIALQWDNIEKELHNDNFWFFLTNYSDQKDYQTRIDLVLDMMAQKPTSSKEKYFTFFKFDQMRKEKDLKIIWSDIQNTFLCLKDWYENHDLYHKIGYLITAKVPIGEIYKESIGKTKTDFNNFLGKRICESIQIGVDNNYGDISYENPNDYKKISRLLLLYNVESVHQSSGNAQWFPFKNFKYGKENKDKKIKWSLEHIHAQQSEGLKTKEQWKEWLKLHIPSVQSLNDFKELVNRMKTAIENEKLSNTEFATLQKEVQEVLSEKGNTEYLHSISNLALLNTRDNAALNNSTFDVKRNKIIEMDKSGAYIPLCTKKVFLKYYTPSSENQLHFWGEADRKAYVEDINQVLKDYLGQKIVLNKEVK